MTGLGKVSNVEFLQELRYRIVENKIDKQELFQMLGSNEVIA
ncbi:5994_t:CDS:1, partial [Scutellospora calospora]